MYLVRWMTGDKRRSWLHLQGFVGGRGLWTKGVTRGGVAAGGRLGPEKLTDTVDGVTHGGVGCGQRGDGAGRVEDRRVIAVELTGYVCQRKLGQLACQVHRDLTGLGDRGGTGRREHGGA